MRCKAMAQGTLLGKPAVAPIKAITLSLADRLGLLGPRLFGTSQLFR
jgi:hypothetical protein